MTPATPPATPAALVHLPALRPGGTDEPVSAQLSLTHCTLVPGWSVGPNGDPLHPTAPALIVEPAGVEIIGERSILGAIRAALLATVSLTRQHRRRHRPHPGRLRRARWRERRRRPDARRLHSRRQGPRRRLLTLGLRQHLLGGARPRRYHALGLRPRRGSQTSRAASVSAFLPGERGHTAPLPSASNRRSPRRSRLFFSLRYGQPAYLKLLASTDDTIRRGADDGGEMGCLSLCAGAATRERPQSQAARSTCRWVLEFGLIYQT